MKGGKTKMKNSHLRPYRTAMRKTAGKWKKLADAEASQKTIRRVTRDDETSKEEDAECMCCKDTCLTCSSRQA
jgi:hypothetical protein